MIGTDPARPAEPAADPHATLELRDVVPRFAESGLPQVALDLVVEPGQCVQITTQSGREAAAFADLCSGVLTPAAGVVRLQGLDWSRLGRPELGALRGRIGRTHHRGAWNGFTRIDHDILMAQLHHTRTPMEAVIDAATALSLGFGLPGLPADYPQALGEADLARAGCVRAFLGQPALLLVEPPVAADPDILDPFMRALAAARDRGAAALCFARRTMRWRGYDRIFTQHLVLNDDGLVRLGIAASGAPA